VSGNDAGEHGGGVFLAPSARPIGLDGSTIASNRAPEGGGGGIWRAPTDEGTVHGDANGLIVARNGREDCAGPGILNSVGGNVDGDGSCGFTDLHDVNGADPLLGPLAYNGGPTPTRALLADSPAIDVWSCMSMKDQRGATRPQGDGCDAGAYEVGSCCPGSEPPYKPGRPPPPGPRSYCGLLTYGTASADVIKGDDGRNDLHGLAGNDRIFGGDNADCLYGGSGNDFMKGGHGHDSLYAKSGDDVLSGGDDEDLLLGYGGSDRLYGGADEDRLYGGPGGDYIKGGGGYDIISAGPGNDVIDAAGGGLDTVDCGSGFDRVKAKRLEHLYGCERVKYVG
jgi:Ca2+-binding RTX toxin-like protein